MDGVRVMWWLCCVGLAVYKCLRDVNCMEFWSNLLYCMQIVQ